MNKWMLAICGILLLSASTLAITTSKPALPQVTSDAQAMLETVKNFERWAISEGEKNLHLAPQVKKYPASPRMYLDRSTELQFINALLGSGQFAPEFTAAVQRYYADKEKDISATSLQEFDQIAKDGGQIWLETENMDIFFCAQEYEYTSAFIDGMTIERVIIYGSGAAANVKSPYGWETPFQFKKVDGKWLITGYCVFK